jgi:hypothetical protein
MRPLYNFSGGFSIARKQLEASEQGAVIAQLKINN